MRRTTRILATMVAVVLGVLPAAAAADDDDPDGGPKRVTGDQGPGWSVEDGETTGDGSGDAGGDGGSTTAPVDTGPPEGFYSVGVRTDEDGEQCWSVRWHDSPGYVPSEDSWTYAEASEAGEDFFGDGYDRCPDDAAAPDPTGAVYTVWSAATFLPENDLHVAPGWALTGMPAYLEIEGDRILNHSVGLPPPFSTLVTFDASAEYEVDWGDESPTAGPYATTGGPYPTGDIVHTYTDTAETTIVVTSTWSGTWSVGTRSGQLPPIQQQHELPLEIRELQTVRTSGR